MMFSVLLKSPSGFNGVTERFSKVNCQEQQGRVQVTIEDDGVGFDLQDHKLNHYGMSIMQERAA
ncbi:hypothetical protein, partial [Vibrio cholerae]|uniref:hypothetical protein n=1 Tax=Vibrio cholerae TaxID=666 RepID=UPI00307FD78E